MLCVKGWQVGDRICWLRDNFPKCCLDNHSLITYFRPMFGNLRRLPGIIEELVDAIRGIAMLLARYLQELSDETTFRDRLQELELSRAKWEAEIEAALVKVESRYKAASSSEARERALRRSNAGTDNGDLASEDDILDAYRSMGWVPRGDAEAGEEEGVPAMPEDVEQVVDRPAEKAAALAVKFGA